MAFRPLRASIINIIDQYISIMYGYGIQLFEYRDKALQLKFVRSGFVAGALT